MKHYLKTLSSDHTPLIFIVIVVLACLLRFTNVPARYTFDTDAISDAVVAYKSVQELQLPITGNFSAAGAFTFGPWYYYHLILFYAITHLPYSVWVANAVISLFSIVIMYLLGKTVKDTRLGLLLAGITAVTPVQISIASSSSNPNIVFPYAALAYIAFHKLITGKRSYGWSSVFGGAVGIAINAHYQAIPMVLLCLGIFFFAKEYKVRQGLIVLGALTSTFIPLLFFNFTNHWHTLRNFIYYSLHGKDLVYVPNSWTIYLKEFWPQITMEFFGLPLTFALLLIIFVISMLLYAFYTRSLSKPLLVFVGFTLCIFIYLRYYWGERHSVYLYYLLPLLFLYLGLAIDILSRKIPYGKYIAAGIVGVLLFFSLRQDGFIIAPKTYMSYVREALELQQSFPNKKIVLYRCNELQYDRAVALSYLLDRQGNVRNKDIAKVAIQSGDCPLPKNKRVRETFDATESAKLSQLYSIEKPFVGFDFSTASEAAIQKTGWQLVDLQRVYNGEVRWYFTEQP